MTKASSSQPHVLVAAYFLLSLENIFVSLHFTFFSQHAFCAKGETVFTHSIINTRSYKTMALSPAATTITSRAVVAGSFRFVSGRKSAATTTTLSETRGKRISVVQAKVAEQLPRSTMVERQLPTTTDGTVGIYGAIAPFKNGFDPLGLSRRITFDDLKRYREAELTHGRVCMLAAVGILVGEYVEGSSFLFDASITGPAINHFQQVPPPFWYALGVVIFIGEATRVQRGWADPFTSDLFTLRDDYVPGEIGFDPLGLCPKSSDELYLDYKLKELSHGRLAMVATAIMVSRELLTGNKIFPQFDLFPYQ